VNEATWCRAFVGVGSNLDDPVEQVRRAIVALDQLPQSRCVRASSLYRTPPWGRTDQPSFINAAVELETALSPRALLDGLIALEAAAGRVRAMDRWGPRVLDLDLLLYAEQRIGEIDLQVPHPHLHERAFVLLPLAEIASHTSVPGRGRIGDLLAGIDTSGLERLVDSAA
jgi:2-amino-4-hydroxy-6-hydroxymethyldihydropteridine diphosphokinase